MTWSHPSHLHFTRACCTANIQYTKFITISIETSHLHRREIMLDDQSVLIKDFELIGHSQQ